MRRALLLALAFSAITCVEFQVFPSHTYLEGSTQLYVPMLERLDAPGFLSRDLVATHPNLSYTAYDEATLFLHDLGHLDFRTALLVQQVLFRAAAVIGVYLLVCAAGFSTWWALAIAAIVNLGAFLPGVGLRLVDPEPVPATFAFGLSVLSMGCLARGWPLLCGLAGGLALIYDPALAAVLWITALTAFFADQRLRKVIRPALTILVVLALLLGNLAQLQPGGMDSETLFGRIPQQVAAILKNRTRAAWVPLWAGHEIWFYLAILICGLWAAARIWPSLNRQARWFFWLPSLLGVLTVPVSAFLLARFGWWLIPQIQPARSLLFTVEFSLIACGIAGIQAFQLRNRAESFAWFSFVLAVIVITHLAAPRAPRIPDREAVTDLARWAEASTWGSSMFLFPDAGRDLYPGVFRAESRRALWVDWESGAQCRYSGSLARTWKERWERELEGQFSVGRLQASLPLPIDYYVLKASNRLAGVRPAYANSDFVVYDSRDLLNARDSLRTVDMKTVR
ncbi:MAG TPA: hypothetical protein VH601_09950 [Bryobacteraceae bacterium]|jgi:hypothetical protein